MASKNRICLLGHLGKDPESRTFPSGDTITNFTMATTEKWNDRETGEPKESTQWHNCVASGKLADIVKSYAKKGSFVDVEGKLTYRKYTDKDKVERTIAEIRVSDFLLLDKRSTQDAQAPSQQSRQPQGQQRQQPAPARTNGRASAPQENWATADDGFPE